MGIAHCDDLLTMTNPVTFVNGLGHSSFTDHCFCSGSIRHHVSHIEIGDSGINLSDHMPLIVSLHFPCKLSSTSHATHDHGGLLDEVVTRDDLPAPYVYVVDVGLSDHRR